MSENNSASSPPRAVPVQANKLTIQNPDTTGYINSEFNEQVPTLDRCSLIESQLKTEIYNRARMVKFFSIIDMLFIIIQFVISLSLNNVSWIFFIFFPLCFCGYYGAKNYNKSSIIGYSCYLFLMSMLYLTIVIAYGSLLYLLIFFIELYIFTFTLKLYRLLTISTHDNIESLQDGWKPEQALIVLYYY